MTYDEMEVLMAVIKTAYPEFYKDYADIDAATALWTKILEEYSAETVTAAVMEHIKHCRFAPKISEINELSIKFRPGGRHGLPTRESIERIKRLHDELVQERLETEQVKMLEGRYESSF